MKKSLTLKNNDNSISFLWSCQDSEGREDKETLDNKAIEDGFSLVKLDLGAMMTGLEISEVQIRLTTSILMQK